MEKSLQIRNSTVEFLTFVLDGKEDGVQVLYKDDTIWATQKAMAVLFEVDRTVITKHLKNIFQSGELQIDTVCAKIAHTAEDGKTYDTQYYSLDAIISVGYRINSMRATNFRRWSTAVLREFAIKGYVIDKKRMKMKEAGLPAMVLESTPKYLRGMKVPVVKAKVGPRVMTLIADEAVFELIPVKKEVKATVSGLYITKVTGVRGPLEKPEGKLSWRAKLKKKAEAANASLEKEKQELEKAKKNKKKK